MSSLAWLDHRLFLSLTVGVVWVLWQVAEQVFDNALVAAGLLDDGRSMLPRIHKLLERLV